MKTPKASLPFKQQITHPKQPYPCNTEVANVWLMNCKSSPCHYTRFTLKIISNGFTLLSPNIGVSLKSDLKCNPQTCQLIGITPLVFCPYPPCSLNQAPSARSVQNFELWVKMAQKVKISPKWHFRTQPRLPLDSNSYTSSTRGRKSVMGVNIVGEKGGKRLLGLLWHEMRFDWKNSKSF